MKRVGKTILSPAATTAPADLRTNEMRNNDCYLHNRVSARRGLFIFSFLYYYTLSRISEVCTSRNTSKRYVAQRKQWRSGYRWTQFLDRIRRTSTIRRAEKNLGKIPPENSTEMCFHRSRILSCFLLQADISFLDEKDFPLDDYSRNGQIFKYFNSRELRSLNSNIQTFKNSTSLV